MADLVFDIIAFDRAAKTFISLSEHIDRFAEKLDRLGGKDVDIPIRVHDEEANAKLDALSAKTQTFADQQLSRWQMIGAAILAGLTVFAPAAAGLVLATVGTAFIGLAAVAEHSN